jgi:formamidopyrimidine-DNA glycosylase
MPELPDIELYLAALRKRVVDRAFSEFKFYNPFALRTVAPKPAELLTKPIRDVFRIGKRIAFELEGGACIVVHLMIAGRFRWLATTAKVQMKITHASWRFDDGILVLTEVSSKKRAGVWLFASRSEAAGQDPGGIDPLSASPEAFSEALLAENRTLKRALTNPKRFSGIGNAYSDEILHAARLSPLKLTKSLSADEVERLRLATRDTLNLWAAKLLEEFKGGDKFPGPGDVTAFRPDFATHGKFGQPCPVCGRPIQRIRYAENETNYCAECQNEGRILADRALSRLLKDDWPRAFSDEES